MCDVTDFPNHITYLLHLSPGNVQHKYVYMIMIPIKCGSL